MILPNEPSGSDRLAAFHGHQRLCPRLGTGANDPDPGADGRWSLVDCYWLDGRSRVPGVDIRREFPDLSSAVHAARDYVVQIERASQ